MSKLYFLNSFLFNTTQTSACTLKLSYTRSIKNDQSFLKQKFHILYIQTGIINKISSEKLSDLKLVMEDCE